MATPDWQKKIGKKNFFTGGTNELPASVLRYQKDVRPKIVQEQKKEENRFDVFKKAASYATNPLASASKDIPAALNFAKEIFKPDERQKKYEEDFLPYASKSSPIMRTLTAPGVATARGISRLINPGLEPLADNIAESYGILKKGGFADQIEQGKLPADFLKEFKTLDKSGKQIVGDTLTAVLTAYMPSFTGGVVKRVAKAPALSNVLKGAAAEGSFGAVYGASDSMSKDLNREETMRNILVSGGVGALFGGILSGSIPVAQSIKRRVQELSDLGYLKNIDLTNVPKKLEVSSTGKSDDFNRAFQDVNSPDYEPYLPETEIPAIDLGNKVKSNDDLLPEIQTGERDFSVIKDAETPGSRVVPFKDEPFVEPGNRPETITSTNKTKPEPSEKFKPREFETQTNQGQMEKIASKDTKKVEEIALGLRQSDDNIPATAHLAYLKKYADETGDVALANRLANSKVASISGQDLQANKNLQEQTLTDYIRIIKDEKIKKNPKFQKETKEIAEEIKRQTNDMKNVSKKDIDDIINELTC